MSPAAKHNTKWIITTTTGLITIITFAFLVGAGFTKNNAVHDVIQTELTREIKRSTTVDHGREILLEKFDNKLDEVTLKQMQVMTNQRIILDAIQDIPN